MDADAHLTHSLAELCVLADTPPRTVRYYVQIGLVDRPLGETRAARYHVRHLEQLLQVRKWSAAGVSLERIRELLHGEAAGTIAVRTHLTVSDGIELSIDPARAGLSPAQVRELTRAVMQAYEALAPGPTPSSPPRNPDEQAPHD